MLVSFYKQDEIFQSFIKDKECMIVHCSKHLYHTFVIIVGHHIFVTFNN